MTFFKGRLTDYESSSASKFTVVTMKPSSVGQWHWLDIGGDYD
jgi:hypothetical protein